ncbi:DUF5412 family protein [Neobacillus niacini]|uniref:DUF5412 family protein n=1 Tax=Neobacillus niacini TaxID=86668 RepID=UPI002FFE6B14
MEKRYNLWSFYLIIVCLGLAAYSLYSNIENAWLIAPPNYILLLVSVIVFILGIKGFKDKRNWQVQTRSWLTVILSFLLSIVLILAILLSLFASSLEANEHIETVHSPDGNYTIDFYRFDAGAAGSFGVRGELDGPLWVKKRIYYQKRVEQIEVEWENNTTILINNHILNLKDGDTYGY